VPVQMGGPFTTTSTTTVSATHPDTLTEWFSNQLQSKPL
jgi:hypothetical protein